MNVNLDNVTIVLKGPKFPGNVGSAARCANNMGIGKLIVVGNRDLDDEAVRQMATHESKEIVDGIRHFDTLDEALAGFEWVVGTTARTGLGSGPLPLPAPDGRGAHRRLPGKHESRSSSARRTRGSPTTTSASARWSSRSRRWRSNR